MSRNYINNKQLYQCILDYDSRRRDAESRGLPRPPMPEYAGKCVQLICQRMATRYNFRNYSFREEMESDAVVDCVNGFYNFDPHRFKNPFGYFTQVAWMAMVRRISSEKKETYLKYKSLQNAYLSGAMWESPEDYSDSGGRKTAATDGPDWMEVMDSIVSDFEAGVDRRRRKSQEKRTEKLKVSEDTSNTILAFTQEEGT